MRVALVHSFYRSALPSGENAIVEAEAAALSAAGHDVLLVARFTDDAIGTPSYRFRVTARVVTGWGGSIREDLMKFNPDVIHVHNLFPNIGRRWMREAPAPVVMTLHNFRPICANGLLFRDGKKCDLCPRLGSHNSLRHKCYRDSFTATLPLTLATASTGARTSLLKDPLKLIVPSESARNIYEGLLPAPISRKLVVIPNGVADMRPELDLIDRPVGRAWCFIGRLSAEKGLAQLLAHWPSDEELIIIGDGPLRPDLERMATPNIRFIGPRQHAEAMAQLNGAAGLVFPSVCHEAQPTTVTEALMLGVPIVALSGSAGADVARRLDPAFVYEGPADLPSALAHARRSGTAGRERARTLYEQSYTLPAWVERLVRTFQTLFQ